MIKPNAKALRDKLLKLSDELQDAYLAPGNEDIVNQVAAENNLTEYQTSQLASISGMVMLGFLHPRDFISTISEDVGVPMMAARDMAREINEKIFRPVRQQLKDLHGISASGVAEQSPAKVEPVSPQPTEPLEPQQPPLPPRPRYDFSRFKGMLEPPKMPQEGDLAKLEQERERKIVRAQTVGAGQVPVEVPAGPARPRERSNVDVVYASANLGEDDKDAKPAKPAILPISAMDDTAEKGREGKDAHTDKLSAVVSRPPERIDLGEGGLSGANNYGGKDPYRETV
jgi:hypothetical protein